MGIIADAVCCIDSGDIIEKSKRSDSLLNTSNIKRSLGLSTSKTIPSSEIRLQLSSSLQHVKTLSSLPISTLNVIRHQYGDPHLYYEVIKPLGHGTDGHVFKIMHKTTGIVRAMKVIPKNNLKPGFTEDEIESEITILKNLDHPKIIKIYEIYSDSDNYYPVSKNKVKYN